MLLPHHLIQCFRADLIRKGPLHGEPSLPFCLSIQYTIIPQRLSTGKSPAEVLHFPLAKRRILWYPVLQEVTAMKSKAAVKRIIETLKGIYPDALCSLQYEKDYELLFAVRLSAQCTDERVNKVTPALFARFPTLESFAEADPAEVGEYIRSCGFFNGKARDLVACAQQLVGAARRQGPRHHGGADRPCSGVGRKTANLILGDVFGQPAYVCDTHCIRITGRLGITDGSKDPVQVERQLRRVCSPQGVQ